MSDDPNVETWLAELDAERNKFTRSNERTIARMIQKLINCGEYPEEWNGKPLDVWSRVQGWGAYWHRYREPLNCPLCKTDLRDREWGPPGKREIGHSDLRLDCIVRWSCPDCKGSWPRP
jgi:hypothetical protein